MSKYQRRDFSLGWTPNADESNGPPNGLLRMDNCVLSERGVLALRRGSSKINADAFQETRVTGLYSCYLVYEGGRLRARIATTERNAFPKHSTAYFLGGYRGDHLNIGGQIVSGITTANNGSGLVRVTTPRVHYLVTGDIVSIYGHSVAGYNGLWTITRINTTAFDLVGSTYGTDGTGGAFELSFGTTKIHLIDYMDRLFLASESVAKKWDFSLDWSNPVVDPYDPSNVTPWGVAMTGTKPSFASRSTDNSVTLDNCATPANWDGSSRELVAGEYLDVTTGPSALAGYEGTASAATSLVPATSGRGVVTRIFNAGANTTEDFQNWPLKASAIKKTANSGSSYTDYTSGVVNLDALNTLASGHWLLIGGHQKFDRIAVDMSASVNANASSPLRSVHQRRLDLVHPCRMSWTERIPQGRPSPRMEPSSSPSRPDGRRPPSTGKHCSSFVWLFRLS
jgi:hypothetical protein